VDESCVWKVSPTSTQKISTCSKLLKSPQFARWSQSWVDVREKETLKARYNAKLRSHQANVESLALIDAAVVDLRRQASKLCESISDLDKEIRVPYDATGFFSSCTVHLKHICKKTQWPIAPECKKLMHKGCSHMRKQMTVQTVLAATEQAGVVNKAAKKVGKVLSKRCLHLSGYMRRLLDRMLGVTHSRHLIEDTKKELDHLQKRLVKVDRTLLGSYEQEIVTEGRNQWACSRTRLADIREQNFKCVKQAFPPMKLVVCKGNQVPRLMSSPRTGQCPVMSRTKAVQRGPGELLDKYDERKHFSRMSFGCQCPIGTQAQDGKCCRQGELLIRKEKVFQTNKTITSKPTCQCPPGLEYVSVQMRKPRWRKVCRPEEVKIDTATCTEHTGRVFDYIKGRRVCCQPEDGQCRRTCPPGHWRLKNGFCQSSMLVGCYRFDEKAYYQGLDVPCLIPSSEMLISEEACAKQKESRWLKSDVAGRSYCKRPSYAWGKLKRDCVFVMRSGKPNNKDCRTFAKGNFNVPRGNPFNDLAVSYFTFISETQIAGEGSPGNDMGKRDVPRSSLPYWYTTWKPRWTRADYNSVRKKAGSQGRRLLVNPFSSDYEVELQESQQYSEEPLPTADVKQPSYGTRRAKAVPGIPLPINVDPKGGFLSSEGVFKMSSWPKLQDDYSIDNLLETGEGAQDARFDPVTVGKTQAPLTGAKGTMKAMDDARSAMNEIKAAAKEWNKAKDRRTPAELTPGPGDGTVKKVCSPPDKAAKCFGLLHNGRDLPDGQQSCLSPHDHAWFRIHCEQF